MQDAAGSVNVHTTDCYNAPGNAFHAGDKVLGLLARTEDQIHYNIRSELTNNSAKLNYVTSIADNLLRLNCHIGTGSMSMKHGNTMTLLDKLSY
jgi:hypothetical protein